LERRKYDGDGRGCGVRLGGAGVHRSVVRAEKRLVLSRRIRYYKSSLTSFESGDSRLGFLLVRASAVENAAQFTNMTLVISVFASSSVNIVNFGGALDYQIFHA